MLPRRVVRVTEAGDPGPTIESVGFPFAVVAGSTNVFFGSGPIAGIIDVVQAVFVLPTTGAVTLGHSVGFAVGPPDTSDVTAFHALPQVFRNIGDPSVDLSNIFRFFGGPHNVVLQCRSRLAMNGESIVCRFGNSNTGTVGAYFTLWYESVEAVGDEGA